MAVFAIVIETHTSTVSQFCISATTLLFSLQFSQQMLFNAIDGFESIMFVLPIWKSNERENEKHKKQTANQQIDPNQAQHEMQNYTQKASKWECVNERDSGERESETRAKHGKYTTIEDDSSNADSKSMNGI